MKCPKCGSSLRESKKKEGYYLCDTCRTRMSLEYINKMSVPDAKESSEPEVQTSSNMNKEDETKKHFPILLPIILVIIGCTFLFIHFNLYEKIESLISPPETPVQLTDSLKFNLIDYEIVSENVTPSPSYEHEYLLVNVQISNNSQEILIVDSMNNFEYYVDNSKLPYSLNSELVLTNLNLNSIENNISVDQSLTGYLCIELPITWNILEIHYSPTIWSSSDLILEIENTD